jgi:hypothetical protein
MTTPTQRITRLLDEGARFIVQLPGQTSIDFTPDMIAILDAIAALSEHKLMNKECFEPKVELTAWWGNDDVDASVQVTQTEWEAIKNGGQFSAECTYCLEGEEYTAYWSFDNGHVTIDGDDGLQCVVGMPIEQLDAIPVTPNGE